MAKLDVFRKLIREEVRAVFQEELAGILKEAVISNKADNRIVERKETKQQIPGTLNTSTAHSKLIPPNLGMSNPLTTLLAETAATMVAEDYRSMDFTSDNAMGFAQGAAREPVVTDTINGMLATARPSSNFDAIQINAVPDYSHLMSKILK